MNLKSNILVFSVFQLGLTHEQNFRTHVRVLSELKSNLIPCGELKGRYNGTDEMSIMIVGFQHRELVESLVKTFNQESYMESHNDRKSFLVYSTGLKEYIGTLTPVSRAEAEASGAYSYSPPLDQFFVTK